MSWQRHDYDGVVRQLHACIGKSVPNARGSQQRSSIIVIHEINHVLIHLLQQPLPGLILSFGFVQVGRNGASLGFSDDQAGSVLTNGSARCSSNVSRTVSKYAPASPCNSKAPDLYAVIVTLCP